jgi:hypothetical protein
LAKPNFRLNIFGNSFTSHFLFRIWRRKCTVVVYVVVVGVVAAVGVGGVVTVVVFVNVLNNCVL